MTDEPKPVVDQSRPPERLVFTDDVGRVSDKRQEEPPRLGSESEQDGEFDNGRSMTASADEHVHGGECSHTRTPEPKPTRKLSDGRAV